MKLIFFSFQCTSREGNQNVKHFFLVTWVDFSNRNFLHLDGRHSWGHSRWAQKEKSCSKISLATPSFGNLVCIPSVLLIYVTQEKKRLLSCCSIYCSQNNACITENSNLASYLFKVFRAPKQDHESRNFSYDTEKLFWPDFLTSKHFSSTRISLPTHRATEKNTFENIITSDYLRDAERREDDRLALCEGKLGVGKNFRWTEKSSVFVTPHFWLIKGYKHASASPWESSHSAAIVNYIHCRRYIHLCPSHTYASLIQTVFFVIQTLHNSKRKKMTSFSKKALTLVSENLVSQTDHLI